MEEPGYALDNFKVSSGISDTNEGTKTQSSTAKNAYRSISSLSIFNSFQNHNRGLIMQCALKAHHSNVEVSLPVGEIEGKNEEYKKPLEEYIPKSIIEEIEFIGNTAYYVESLDPRIFINPPVAAPFPLVASTSTPNMAQLTNINHETQRNTVMVSLNSQTIHQRMLEMHQHLHNSHVTQTTNLQGPNLYISSGSMHEPKTQNDQQLSFPTGPALHIPPHSSGRDAFPAAPSEIKTTSIDSDISNQNLNWELYEMCERIWRNNDQKASLYLQERIKACVPGEYELLVNIIHERVSLLMVHRFGNFLVQCMLATAKEEDIERFTATIIGRISALAMNQFCCHVIQKLLDVGPLVVQARVASELLDDVYDTMTSPFGTHVWQKLLQLPWSKKLPPLGIMIHNAVRLQMPHNGWVSIAQTESGCSSIRSYLCLNQKESAPCANDLLEGIHELMTCKFNTSPVICKLAMLNSTRARTMALIFSRAYEYSKHPTGSEILINLLRLKIPSFPTRFSASITSYRLRMQQDENAARVLEALRIAQGNGGSSGHGEGNGSKRGN